MFCIHIINKLFDMIPRPKHYKDVINVPFVVFRFNFNRTAIQPFLFIMTQKKAFGRVVPIGDPKYTF